MANDEGREERFRIEQNASAAGRPYFGWRDLAEIRADPSFIAGAHKPQQARLPGVQALDSERRSTSRHSIFRRIGAVSVAHSEHCPGGIAMVTYRGNIKSFSAKSGYGFIECAETQALHGKDIIVLKNELPDGFAQAGDVVAFTIAQGPKGPQAANVQLGEMPGGSYAGAIKFFNAQKGWGFIECVQTQEIYGKDIIVLKSDLAAGTAKAGDPVTFDLVQGPKGPQAANVQQGGMPGEYRGVIKSFNPQKGFGFIECAQTQAIYGKDIIVLKTELPSGVVDTGHSVSFEVAQGPKGPQAANVLLQGGYSSRDLGARKPHVASHYGGQANPYAVPGPAYARGSQANSSYEGEVKSFNPEKGWGFVTSTVVVQLFGKDILFRMSSGLAVPFLPGQRVTFDISQSPKGPEAINLSLAGPSRLAFSKIQPIGASPVARSVPYRPHR